MADLLHRAVAKQRWWSAGISIFDHVGYVSDEGSLSLYYFFCLGDYWNVRHTDYLRTKQMRITLNPLVLLQPAVEKYGCKNQSRFRSPRRSRLPRDQAKCDFYCFPLRPVLSVYWYAEWTRAHIHGGPLRIFSPLGFSLAP